MKRRRNSKTYWAAGLLAAFGAAQLAMPDIRALIPAEWYPAILMAVAGLMAVLREMTTDGVRAPKE